MSPEAYEDWLDLMGRGYYPRNAVKDATKFCKHCQKHGHTDSECWSTRAIPPLEASMFPAKQQQIPFPPTAVKDSIDTSVLLRKEQL